MLPGDPLVRGVVRGAGAASQVWRVLRPLPGDGAALAGAEATVSSDRRIALLLDVFDQAFDRRAWHGTALWGSIRGLSPRGALWRPAHRRHNIWEVVLHTAYWKCIVRRRLTRDLELEFPRTGSNWPALPARSEEHTSELQSQSNIVCRLLLEKKDLRSTTNLDKS